MDTEKTKKLRSFFDIIKNIIGNKLVIIFSLVCLGFPIVFNAQTVPMGLKISMIVANVYNILYFGSLLTICIMQRQWKSFGVAIFCAILSIIGVLSFINYNLWGVRNISLGIIYAVICFFGLYATISGLFNIWITSEKLPAVLMAVATVSLLVASVNEKQNNLLPANLYYKISVGLLYLIAIALYVNQYIHKERPKEKVISNIIGIVFWGTLILVSFPFYIQWCGLQENNFNAFVSVYSALIGGGITLAGVAWTIRKSDKDRKEEEIKKARPVFSFNAYYNPLTDVTNKKVCFDELSKEYSCHTVAILENSDRSAFSVEKIHHDNQWLELLANKVILPEAKVFLDFTFDNPKDLILQVKDCLDNIYYYEIKVILIRKAIEPYFHTIRELREISVAELKERNIEV